MDYQGRQVIRLALGDCIERMQEIPTETIGAIITDPPYGLEFMGKDWDKLKGPGHKITEGAGFSSGGSERFKGSHLPAYSGGLPNFLCANCGGSQRGRDRKGFTRCSCESPEFPQQAGFLAKRRYKMQEWHKRWLTEAFRVLRPGGVAKVFSATRTFHRLAAAMEEVGFELLPEHSLEAWGYSTGFPKSLSLGKAVEAMETFGGSGSQQLRQRNGHTLGQIGTNMSSHRSGSNHPVEVRSTQGLRFLAYGTALKPAWEPFLVGRKAYRSSAGCP